MPSADVKQAMKLALLVLGVAAVVLSCGGDEAPAGRQLGTATSATTVPSGSPGDGGSGDEVTTVPSSTLPSTVSDAEADADAAWLVETSGARTIVAGDAELLITWDGTDYHRLTATAMLTAAGRDPEAASAVYASWADDDFVYWSVAADEADPFEDWIGIVTGYDGSVVCDLRESIHHVTRRADGTFVAAVERFSLADDGTGPVQAFAVDCLTGEERPIEPFVVHEGDGEVEIIETVAGRRFTFQGDAEGNADLLNADGLVVNGEDYAGSHVFDADGGRVLYGDYGIGASPHLTRHLVARTTDDGALLWRAELESWALFQAWTSRAVVVALAGPEADPAEPSTAEIVVLDPADGSVVDRRSTPLPLLHLS